MTGAWTEECGHEVGFGVGLFEAHQIVGRRDLARECDTLRDMVRVDAFGHSVPEERGRIGHRITEPQQIADPHIGKILAIHPHARPERRQ